MNREVIFCVRKTIKSHVQLFLAENHVNEIIVDASMNHLIIE